jgi:glyoxylase-like metal-dependent hydrolase (beta-lactamase superfamily II)
MATIPTQVVEGLWQISLGSVNAFLLAPSAAERLAPTAVERLDQGNDLALIDTGVPKSEDKIVAAIERIGRKITDLRHIIVTHCHPDHAGSVAALKRMSGARVYMHPIDAAMVRKGESGRPMSPAPGVARRLMYALFIPKQPVPIEPCSIDQEIQDGTELPIAGGLKAFHVPGQCAGQVALLWPGRRLLFAADACANIPSFGHAIGYENLEDARQSLRTLAALDFDTVVFGHGSPIMSGGSQKFRRAFAR